MLLLQGHQSTVYALAFSPDGSQLFSGSKDGHVDCWDETQKSITLQQSKHTVNALALNPDGQWLAIGTEAGWQMTSNDDPNATREFVSALVGVTSIRFLSASLIAVGYGHRVKQEPGRLELFDWQTGIARTPQFRSVFGVRAVDTHPATQRVAWGEWGGKLQHGPRLSVWEIGKSDPIKFSLQRTPLAIAFHPDGNLLAAAAEWGFTLFDLNRKQEKVTVRGHKGNVSSLAISPDGRTLATGSWDGTVKFWNATTGAERAAFEWRIGKIFSLAFAPDGLRIAAGSESGAIVVWDVE
jgi:WD40 repeat protein